MTWCTVLKARRCSTGLPTECILCSPARSITKSQYLQGTTPNIESCLDLLVRAIQEEFLPALFGEATDEGDYRLAHIAGIYSGLALLNTVNSATPTHQANKEACSHRISTLKDETTFETAKHTQTMAEQKQQSEHPEIDCMKRSSSA